MKTPKESLRKNIAIFTTVIFFSSIGVHVLFEWEDIGVVSVPTFSAIVVYFIFAFILSTSMVLARQKNDNG